MPYLKSIKTTSSKINANQFPFTIPAFSNGIEIEFSRNVTFLVGENGSGKSTLLEAIAQNCGFNPQGGNRNHYYNSSVTESSLYSAFKFSWCPKITQGFFLRAESYFNFATYVDQIAEDDPQILHAYGGKSLHAQSHGESFLSLFTRFRKGIFLLDEPEAALSPKRQLSLLVLIHELEKTGNSQFIIATHSPILLGYPEAALFSLDGNMIRQVAYNETEHYLISRDFLLYPERYLKHLFSDEPED